MPEESIQSPFLEFCRRQVSHFHMQDLTRYVQDRIKTAPDSPRRILSELQREGRVRVKLLSRKSSLYYVEWVEGKPAEQAELFQKTA